MKIMFAFFLLLLVSHARASEYVTNTSGWNPIIENCLDICECLTPIIQKLNGEDGIAFQVDGNRFHLQKLLDDKSKENECEAEKVAVPEDGVYLKCRERKLECTSSNLIADFSLDNGSQSRDADIRDYVYCSEKDEMMVCTYLNATKDYEWNRDTYSCRYDKPRKFCQDNFDYYKGLCIKNAGAFPYKETKRICNRMEAKLIGETKRDWAYVNQSNFTNDRIWIKTDNNSLSGVNCTSARNNNASADKVMGLCSDRLTVLCTKRAQKQVKCNRTPLLDFTTMSPTTLLGMTTTVPETTTIKRTTAAEESTESDLTNYPAETGDQRLKKDLFQVQTKIADYFEKLNVTPPKLNEQPENAILVDSLDDLIDRLASSVSQSDQPAKSLTVETSTLVIKIIPLGDEAGDETLGGGVKNQSFSLDLPEGFQKEGVTLAMSAADVSQTTMSVAMETSDSGEDKVTSEKPKAFIGSLVATISLMSKEGNSLGNKLSEPLRISFSTTERPGFAKQNETLTPSCRYWKHLENGGGVWSDDGCEVESSNATHTRCKCDHLTSFAVLMSVGPKEKLSESDVIHYMTLIGCSLSIFCLGTMLLIFIAQKLFRADRNIIHMNLAFSLMVGQLIFLVAIERTEPQMLCKAIGMSLHFFFLGSFFWMLNEGIYLVSKTRSQKSNLLKMPTFLAIGWGCPLITVGVTAAVSFGAYGTETQCWLRVDNGGIWAFVGPAIVIVIANMIMLSNVIRVFLSLRANMKKKQVERTWLALRAMLLTLPLLGLTWLFGLLTAIDSTTVVFEYLFVIFNSLQGVFIFVLYCVLNDEVRKTLQKKVYKLGFMSKTSAGRTSKTTA
ncbi:Adhesion G protein-coupled receptor L3 [Holothuria leucospilota]|uniref:Adhesion G protein-coupled receptor L3 n=1 Tax=Holothuria leucospilota TaxID=206669 RepID=A0A9Q1BQA7_HOLLE|nr:Adhesion G protein-coupled receptor L3 [Holothuria leucospilota]